MLMYMCGCLHVGVQRGCDACEHACVDGLGSDRCAKEQGCPRVCMHRDVCARRCTCMHGCACKGVHAYGFVSACKEVFDPGCVFLHRCVHAYRCTCVLMGVSEGVLAHT